VIVAVYLPAVANILRENAVVIANAVSVGGEAERGHRVKEAGGQSTEAAIAESGVLFNLLQLLDIQTQLPITRSR